MTDAPLRPITPQEIDQYREQGVVCLRRVIPAHWVDQVRKAVDDLFATLEDSVNAKDYSAVADGEEAAGTAVLRDSVEPAKTRGRFQIDTLSWYRNDTIRAFALDSPLPGIAATLFGADRVNFFGDQVFLKEPGTGERTAFHQDQPYFNVDGTQVCSMWCPVDIVTRDSSAMGYVPGSHLWGKIFKAQSFASGLPFPGSEYEDQPRIEGNEEAFGVVYFEVEPGDVIVHDYRTLHGSGGNITMDRKRRAASMRYAGDDARYLLRPGAPKQPYYSHNLRDGDRLDCKDFPLAWSREESRA